MPQKNSASKFKKKYLPYFVIFFLLLALISYPIIKFLFFTRVIQNDKASVKVVSTSSSPLPSISPNTFTSPDGLFQANFPNTPNINKGNLPVKNFSVRSTQYVDTDERGNKYLIQTFLFPDKYLQGSTIQESLEGVVYSIQAAIPGSRMISTSYSTFNGLEAIDGTIRTDEKYLRAKIIAKGNYLYVVSTLGEGEANSQTIFTQLLSSFTLLK